MSWRDSVSHAGLGGLGANGPTLGKAILGATLLLNGKGDTPPPPSEDAPSSQQTRPLTSAYVSSQGLPAPHYGGRAAALAQADLAALSPDSTAAAPDHAEDTSVAPAGLAEPPIPATAPAPAPAPAHIPEPQPAPQAIWSPAPPPLPTDAAVAEPIFAPSATRASQDPANLPAPETANPALANPAPANPLPAAVPSSQAAPPVISLPPLSPSAPPIPAPPQPPSVAAAGEPDPAPPVLAVNTASAQADPAPPEPAPDAQAASTQPSAQPPAPAPVLQRFALAEPQALPHPAFGHPVPKPRASAALAAAAPAQPAAALRPAQPETRRKTERTALATPARKALAGKAPAGKTASGPKRSGKFAAKSQLALPVPALPVPAFGRPGKSQQAADDADDADLALAETALPTAHSAPPTALPTTTPQPITSRPAAKGFTDTSPARNFSAAPTFTYDDELILQIQTAQGEMTDTIVAYGTRSGTYLPLGAMARFLDMAIAISDDGHFAQGWFVDEKHRLTLNLRARTLIVDGRDMALAPGDAAAMDGELYVRSDLYAKLFPLELTTNLRAAMITVKTRVPFPFEQKLAREAQREKLAGRQANQGPRRWPRESTPYTALSFPLADIEMRAVSDKTLGTRVESELRLAGDLAFLTAKAFVSGTSRDGLTGAHFELGRRDPDARLLGPLRATEFQLGDISTSSLPMGLRSITGRGAAVTNSPLERASIFDKIDLRGDLPEGYEVEMYRNGILVDSTRTAVGGQYQFLQVPVDYGLNVIRLVFFGPQGQSREEVRNISVGDGRLSPGQLIYSLNAAQKDTSLINVHLPNFVRASDYGAWRTTAQLEYGLNRHITVALNGGWTQRLSGSSWMAGLGLRTGLGGMAARLDLGLQGNNGKAAQLALAGGFKGIGYLLTHAEYTGAFSDEVRAFTNELLTRATEVNLNATLKLGAGPSGLRLPLTAQFRRIENAAGQIQTGASLRGSVATKGLLISHTLDYAHTKSPGIPGITQLTGTFDLATFSRSRSNVRGSLQYAVAPHAQLRTANIEFSHALDDRTLLRAAVSQSFGQAQTRLSLAASRRFGRFDLAVDGNYSLQNKDYGLFVRLGLSLGRNPLTGRLFTTPPGLASGGAVAVRSFADTSGNGRYDPGEPLLPEVAFSTGSTSAKSNAQGVAFLGGLGDGNRASFQIDADTLPDIAMAPASSGIEIVPRAGRIHVSEFAIQSLSDIEGSAFFDDVSRNRKVSGLALRLVDSAGKQVARARTEADGFFLFERVRPGTYQLELDPTQAARLKIHLDRKIALTVGPVTSVLQERLVVRAD